jgi:hypothetical protein
MVGKRVIEVDDSGWGDLLGGVFLCFNDVAMGRYVLKEIPVEYFQGESFLEKKYLAKSRELAESAIKELDIKRGEDVEFHVCTGYINNAVASFLIQEGFHVLRRKIEGQTQLLVEKAYEEYVKKLTGLESVPASGRRFFTLLKWVREDLANREKYVKTGWRSWNERWRTYETQKNYKACINCKWLTYSGPHVGCFRDYQYHSWLPQKVIKTFNCPNWAPRNSKGGEKFG